MPLHTPYFVIEPRANGEYQIRHNCDGGLSFAATEMVDEKTFHLLAMAIAEGKRRRSAEFNKLLEDK